MDFLNLGVKRALEDPAKDPSQESAKRSKQDEDLKRSIKKKLRHLPRKVSFIFSAYTKCPPGVFGRL